jgi:amidophosphoribosyltransferase
MESVMQATYEKAKQELEKHASEQMNVVKDIYAPFTDEEIASKIAEMVRPKGMRAQFDILFQSVDNLHVACPSDLGDWYFTGDFPTPGGTQVANRAFVYYMEGRKERAY